MTCFIPVTLDFLVDYFKKINLLQPLLARSLLQPQNIGLRFLGGLCIRLTIIALFVNFLYFGESNFPERERKNPTSIASVIRNNNLLKLNDCG